MIKVPLWIRDLLKQDGSRELTGDWDIGNGRIIKADKIRARDGDGLALYDDGGNGIFVKDGGNVGCKIANPATTFNFNGVLGAGNKDTAFKNTGNAVIELITDSTFGSTNDKHTGIRLFSYDMSGWESAKLGIQVSSDWKEYIGGDSPAMSDMAMVIGQFQTIIKGRVGVCTMAPTNPLAVNRQGNDGVVIDIKQADAVEGTISVAGNTVSYNSFMGAHYTQMKAGQKIPLIGAIVVATGEIIPCEAHIEVTTRKKKNGEKEEELVKETRTCDVSGVEKKEYFSYVKLASQKADKRVYGVYHAKMSEDAKGQSFGKDNTPIHQIASVGLYKVRITDTNGNIVAGDYIQSSIRPGEGERQKDDILHNYTVAKSIVNIDWDEVEIDSELGYKWKLIPATLHCG